MANPQNTSINGTLTFNGSKAGACAIQAQSLGGTLVLQLPNINPNQGQVLVASAINGSVCTLGWANLSSALLVSPTLSGTITVSGTETYTTANPVFFSSQGNGSKVQLSTGNTAVGNVVFYDANGNTANSANFNFDPSTNTVSWIGFNGFFDLRTGPNNDSALGIGPSSVFLRAQEPGGTLAILVDTAITLSCAGVNGTQVGAAGQRIGFLGATPIVKPTVIGSRGANAALTSLLTQLAALGLIVDGTS